MRFGHFHPVDIRKATVFEVPCSGSFIDEISPKIIYFRHLKKYFLDQSTKKTFYLIWKTEALVT